MYKDVIRDINAIDLFPVIAFVIFFAFFIGLIVYVVRLKKNEVSQMAAIPLQEEQPVVPRVSPHSKT
jgi:cbb3-type cytochrome oxidase subunit 3